MRISPTLSAYIGRHFLVCFFGVLCTLLLIVFLFDIIELLRRSAGRTTAPASVLVQLTLLKMPKLAQEMVPFVVLFSSMIAFWRLTRSHELTVVRAAGVSVWQFLFPVVGTVILIGGLILAIFNPVSAVLYSKYEQLEAQLFRGRANLLAVSPTGVWLRQAEGATNSVVHALRVASQDFELYDVIIFTFEGQDKFIGRIDAASARLEPGYWVLTNAWVTSPERPGRFEHEHRLPTDMTRERIQDGFAAPETISFWDLPAFIQIGRAHG